MRERHGDIRRLMALISTAMLVITGCGQQAADISVSDDVAQDVELAEPVGAMPGYVTAQRREIAVVGSYPGVVVPHVETYAYDTDQPFGGMDALPGDEVIGGDLLFHGSVEEIERSIADISEADTQLVLEHDAKAADHAYDLALARKKEYETAEAYQSLLSDAPEETEAWYTAWARGTMPAESAYKSAVMAKERLELSYDEESALFELEHGYNGTRMERLSQRITDAQVTADKGGSVVAAATLFPGDRITSGTDILAVGDMESPEIICDYIARSEIDQAEEVYALADGRRIEVAYQTMDQEEYRRRKARDGEVHTVFLPESAADVEAGQYVVIVVVGQRTPDALCVPKGAVHKDEAGSFVYLYSGGDSVMTYVSTGASDNGFIQILGGLSEGDRVIYDTHYDIGGESGTVSRGDVYKSFSADGRLMYPGASWTINPAMSGTCYLKELCVERYEQITAGQVLARIEVVVDTIEADRLRRRIQRQDERLGDLRDERATIFYEEGLERLDRQIRDREMTRQTLIKELERITRYSGVIELKSDYDGIVTDVCDIGEGQIIAYGERLVQTAENDTSYIYLEDQGGLLSYGNTCTVSYLDGAGTTHEVQGRVVTVSEAALPVAMHTGHVLVRVDMEDMATLITSGSDNSSGYWRRALIHVEAQARVMRDVLLIPRSAVYNSGEDTYVMTRDSSGETRLVRFTSGGTDGSNYWVAYGDITEGMTICW